jgi:hypothetical protein
VPQAEPRGKGAKNKEVRGAAKHAKGAKAWRTIESAKCIRRRRGRAAEVARPPWGAAPPQRAAGARHGRNNDLEAVAWKKQSQVPQGAEPGYDMTELPLTITGEHRRRHRPPADRGAGACAPARGGRRRRRAAGRRDQVRRPGAGHRVEVTTITLDGPAALADPDPDRLLALAARAQAGGD